MKHKEKEKFLGLIGFLLLLLLFFKGSHFSFIDYLLFQGNYFCYYMRHIYLILRTKI